MNPKTYLKLEERYKAHLKFKRYSTRYRCQKITDVFSYLKFLYANDYPLTEFLNEHLQEFTDITYKEYYHLRCIYRTYKGISKYKE